MVRRLILLSAHRNSWHYYPYSIVVEMNSPEADRAMMGLRGSRRNPNLIAEESIHGGVSLTLKKITMNPTFWTAAPNDTKPSAVPTAISTVQWYWTAAVW